jgi:hypothetical protein
MILSETTFLEFFFCTLSLHSFFFVLSGVSFFFFVSGTLSDCQAHDAPTARSLALCILGATLFLSIGNTQSSCLLFFSYFFFCFTADIYFVHTYARSPWITILTFFSSLFISLSLTSSSSSSTIQSPILARFGVKLVTHSMAQGGLGTLQSSLGSRDLYGSDIDLLLWDSSMTEAWPSHKDFFLRQAVLAGSNTNATKMPVIWAGAGMDFDVLKYLHDEADIDIGQFGLGTDGIIPVTDAQQALTHVPFASRYMKCDASMKQPTLCDQKVTPRFCSTCWIDRDDIPLTKAQELFPNLLSKPHAQVKWHPGWRVHQLQGRVLTMALLDALHDALQIWSNSAKNNDAANGGAFALQDADWHVTQYYQNQRNKLQALNQREEQAGSSSSSSANRGACWEMQNQGLPGRVCTTSLHGATQHTPRRNPSETSLTRYIRPASANGGYKPQNLQRLQYDGPDVHNVCFDPEPGAIDVLAIISSRRRRQLLQESSASSFSSWQDEEGEEENEEYNYMPRLFRQLHESRQQRVQQQQEKEQAAALAVPSPTASTTTSRANRNLRAWTRNKGEPSSDLALVPNETIDSYLSLVHDDRIEPGIGWQVEGELPGICDGSYNAICGREASNACPLLGHHDGRGQVVGNEYSGWLVFDLPAVEKGLIIIKLFTGNPPTANHVTDGWTSVNNKDGSATRRRQTRQLSNSNSRNETTTTTTTTNMMTNCSSSILGFSSASSQHDERRSLAGKPLLAQHILPDDTFAFDFAINGKITTWNKREFLERKKDVQRLVEAFTLLDDSSYIGQPARNVELAIRMRGCGRHCMFGVTHLYWA